MSYPARAKVTNTQSCLGVDSPTDEAQDAETTETAMKNYQATKDKSGNWYVQKDGKAYCEMSWICGDPELNAALLAKKLNEHAVLETIADDMATVLVAEFGSLKNARHLAQSQVGIGYWAQVLHNYDQLDAVRKTNTFPVS